MHSEDLTINRPLAQFEAIINFPFTNNEVKHGRATTLVSKLYTEINGLTNET